MDKRRLPLNGTFELTGRCNLQCKMCLVRVDQQRIDELNARELTTAEWIDMAKQIFEAGTLNLLLTGGEVMLRPDFCEIYEAIAKMGFLLTVYTNATMVNDKVMEVFKKYPPHKIGVTMYGASNETYEKMCGDKKGYDHFIEGIQKLRTLPSLFDLRTTIIQDNLADLPAMKDYVLKEFGPDKTLTISRMVSQKIRGGVAHPQGCRLTPKQNVEIVHRDIVGLWKLIKNGEIQLPEEMPERLKFKRYALPDEKRYLFENCDAGINSYVITWDGKMYACELLDQGYTEPLNDGFNTAWEHLPEQYPLSQANETCLSCKYAGLCQSCPATRLAETGDYFGIPEYSCKEAEYLHDILTDLEII